MSQCHSFDIDFVLLINIIYFAQSLFEDETEVFETFQIFDSK